MTALTAVCCGVGGLVTALLLVCIGTLFGARQRHGQCASCRHGRGLHDRYTGRCAARVNSARWLHRALGVRQMTGCKCVSEATS
jgi:hypothetical protein